MGSRGPIPKRDAERRRRNKPDWPTETLTTTAEVRVPAADPAWCSRAKRLWRAAKESPVVDLYQATDWQALAYLCDLMTTLFRPGRLTMQLEAVIRSAATGAGLTKEERLYLEWMLAPVRPSAQMVASMNSLMGGLGLTEGDRRRMRIQIARLPEAAAADVTEMDEYRRARQG